MRYKYYYCVIPNQRSVGFLDAHKIRYRLSGGGIVPTFAIFSFWSSTPNAESLQKELMDVCGGNPVVTIEYSKADLANAKLLVVRPKKQSIVITNGMDAFSTSCESVDLFGITRTNHEWQIGTLAISKEPPTTATTSLWSSDTGFAYIFADYRVRDLSVANKLVGVDLQNVYVKKGQYSNKLYQMTSQYIIPQDLLAEGYGEQMKKCPICGKKQYSIDSSYQLHLTDSEIFNSADLFVTERIFGDGIPAPIYIISQRFYRLLNENKLAGGVSFEPVKLV